MLFSVCVPILMFCAGQGPSVLVPNLPDAGLAEAYERAAVQNVLAAVNPKVFPGYWSVCADGQGFGYGNTYPSLDGHQMADALLWLGQPETVKANWDYVRAFQKPDGLLPLAILPGQAGKPVGDGVAASTCDANGGLYRHWVPGNPLGALAAPTYIQNADILFRYTQDRVWLAAQLPSVNLAADQLISLITPEGRVRGAGYYVEFPTRIESDGVAQCLAIDALRRVAALNRLAGDAAKADAYMAVAERVRAYFTAQFWAGDHFAEYWNPEHGFISNHGLTDTDWAAIATGVATPEQRDQLWPRLRSETGFYYGGIPTGIASRPDTYEEWEFTRPTRHDLAAMGRVWYLESWARAAMNDGEGILDALHRVIRAGKGNGYYWRERYEPGGQGGFTATGPNTYCEYPANLIRIVQRFVLGVEFERDGDIRLAPTVPESFWNKGFGQTLMYRGARLAYQMNAAGITGGYTGATAQRVKVRLNTRRGPFTAKVNGQPWAVACEGEMAVFELPSATSNAPAAFQVEPGK